MRHITRQSLSVLAAAFAVSLAATAARADLTPIEESVRIGGTDRYAVAAGVSAYIAEAPQSTVYVVSGEVFPDALSAGPAAYADRSPILLTRRTELPAEAADELARLNPERVIAVGGPRTIDTNVLRAIEAALPEAQVDRISGIDRYAVAAQLATARSAQDTVFLTSGLVFPDALSAGPAAASREGSILLTTSSALPESTKEALRTVAPRRVFAVGGPATISTDVLREVESVLPGAQVDRISGADRYAVSTNVAQTFWSSGANSAFLASGEKFPDALAGTPAAGINNAPILLTQASCHPYNTRLGIDSVDPAYRIVLGGELSAYSGSTTCGPKPSYPFGEDMDCHDFASQRAAQEWFDYWNPKVGDVFRLDSDDDGKVCEVW